MIIFYNKNDGRIVGNINGRINTPDQLKMWIGDKDKVDRLVVDWKQIGREYKQTIKEEEFEKIGVTEDGTPTYKKNIINKVIKFKEFEPDSSQKDIFNAIDKDYNLLKLYKIDTKTKKLIKLA